MRKLTYDPRDLSRSCAVCEKPTRSHRIPNGWLCHTCLSDPDVDVRAVLDVPFEADLDPAGTYPAPLIAGGRFRLRACPTVMIIEECYPFEDFPHALLLEHPTTTLPFEIPVDEATLATVRADLNPTEVDQLP